MKLVKIFAALLFSSAVSAQSEIKIGKQVWTSANLNVEKFRNGDDITEAKTYEEWSNAMENMQPAWCYYDNDTTIGKKYGKLYNWYAVKDKRGLAPVGWHIPANGDWDELIEFLGGEDKAGAKMKSKEGWDKEGNGSNSSGFSGFPGGFRMAYVPNGGFINLGAEGRWWTTGDPEEEFVWCHKLSYENDWFESDNKLAHGYSVRCIKD